MPVATLEKPKNEQFKSLNDVQVFRCGTHRDMSGRVMDWSSDILAEAAACYDPSLHEAPIVIGHDGKGVSDEERALGWVKSVKFADPKLLCDYGQVDPVFADDVNAGRYKKRSISFYEPDNPNNPVPGKYYVRHVAYVLFPAVKGMDDHGSFNEQLGGVRIEFSDGDRDYMEISEESLSSIFSEDNLRYAELGLRVYSAMGAISTILRRMRDKEIATDGIDAADSDIPDSLLSLIQAEANKGWDQLPVTQIQLDGVNNAIAQLWNEVYALKSSMASSASANSSYSEDKGDKGNTVTDNYSEDIAAIRAEVDSLKTENAALKGDVQRLTQANADKDAAMERQEVGQFVEGLIKNFKANESERNELVTLIIQSPNNPESAIAFNEGDEALTPRERLKRHLSSRTPIVDNRRLPVGNFSESGGRQKETGFAGRIDEDSLELDIKVQKLAREKSLSYEEAYIQVVNS